MISIKKQFLFVHVHKTGGNSVQNLLRNYSEDKIVCTEDFQDGIERFDVRNSRYGTKKHSTLFEYKQVLEPYVFKKLYKFSTIRNPWDLLISYYFSPHRKVPKWKREDFIHVIDEVLPLRNRISIPTFINQVSQKIGFSFAWSKKELTADINFLMRFEYLDQDFETVCAAIDIPYSPLPKRNQSSRQHYSHYYDDELKERVRERFQEEIEFGDYEFEYCK